MKQPELDTKVQTQSLKKNILSVLKSAGRGARAVITTITGTKLVEFFIIAMQSLSANKLRSVLTMLGIIIGVGAVISLMSIGRGAQATITSTFAEMGTNLFNVVPRSPDVGGIVGMSPGYATQSLTLEDAQALERIPSVVAVVPVNENFIQSSYGDESKTSIIHGASPDYATVYNYHVASGQFFAERHVAARDMVVVLGAEVAKDLLGDEDPVGKVIKIKGYRFTVLGTFARKGGAIMGVSLDNVIVVPITTFQSRLFTMRTPSGEDAVQSLAVKYADNSDADAVKADIQDILRRRHRIAEDEKSDFAVVSQEQIAGVMTQVTGIFTIFLGAIASISLLVGGIGIMNIMLVSVTERTREIGIRKAIGAKRKDILLQFLLEALLLSLAGGVVGIVGGWLVAVGVSMLDMGGVQLHAAVTPDIVILAVSVSLFIGVASGLYPAMRAARLNPIDDLHYG